MEPNPESPGATPAQGIPNTNQGIHLSVHSSILRLREMTLDKVPNATSCPFRARHHRLLVPRTPHRQTADRPETASALGYVVPQWSALQSVLAHIVPQCIDQPGM